MATILEYTKTGKKYILLGSGFGMSHAEVPSAVFGNLSPDTMRRRALFLCVCDEHGNTFWIADTNAKILSIDG